MSENLPVALVRSVGWEEPAMVGGGFVLPSGTVTLVLGDVEGSTRAWENDPASTEAAVVELNELIDELVGRFDGVRPVEQGEGDSFVAAFARARDGITCALAIQQRLTGAVLRLRLGVHTGDVVRRDEGNYVGPAIIRTARLRNLAHGGQTVVSEATRELVADTLPNEVTLRDLGVHRLKDLSRPERVFQLCHPDLQADFPALRSLDLHANNLPIQRTTFIGRAAEIAELTKLVSDERLVTITGSGGCGKTRLALQVAAELIHRFPDGVWLVELAAVTNPDGVAAKAAQALAVLQGPGMAPVDSVVAHLATQQVLLVFDNCEHVSEASAGLVDAVLSGCAGVRVLATSRQPLAVEGEVCWRVPPLSLPPDDAGAAGIEGLSRSEAAQLFVERARRARPGFDADERHRHPIAQICRRLDGIPLAIELAAARVRVLSPAQIADGLNQRFALLTGAARTALPRQQTLEASLDWSHALLTEPERIVYRRLGVFPASFDIDAATDVAQGGDVEPWQVLDLVTLLVDKNLLAVDDDAAETARYRLLETVRHYALHRLHTSGEHDAARTRHRDHYLALAEMVVPHLETAERPAWFARLELDYPNMEAALTWSRDNGHDDELCRIVDSLVELWSNGGPRLGISEAVGAEWVDAALAVSAGASPGAHGWLCRARSVMAYRMHDYDTALVWADEGVRIAREHHDDKLLGRILLGFALALGGANDAEPVWEEAIAASRRAGDTFGLAETLACAGGMYYLHHDPAVGSEHIEEALVAARSVGNMVGLGLGLASAATLALKQGKCVDAAEMLDRAAALTEQAPDRIITLVVGMTCSWLYVLTGRYEDTLAVITRLAQMRERTGVGSDWWELQIRALVAATNRDEEAIGLVEQALGCAGHSPVPRAGVLWAASMIYPSYGHLERARSLVEEMTALAATQGLVFDAVDAKVLDAWVKRLSGEAVAAEQAAHEALRQGCELPKFTSVVDALETLGGLAAEGQSYEEAGRLLGAAAALRDETGYQLCLSERDADIVLVRDALGEERFDVVYVEGRALSVEDAVAYARRGRGERKRPTIGWDSLTPTEDQVVQLVREGRTNAEIGERLFVSPRTVQSHLTRIYTKLGVTSRTELAARAATERL